jgi:hypothetical protein
MTVIPPIDPPALPADYTQHALTVMAQVRELGRTVKGFAFSPEGRRSSIGTVASLPEEFLQRSAAALDVNPGLGAAFGVTATEVREALSFKREYTNAAKEVHLVAKGMEDTVAESTAFVGEKCLRFYHAARRANRRNASESMVPHLAEMAHALGKGRKKKKVVPPDPAALVVAKGAAK